MVAKKTIRAEIKMHNEFLVQVKDSRTGEITKEAKAYNIVLNHMFTRLCPPNTYWSSIGFGRGTGVLDPARTTLFSEIARLTPTNVESVLAYPTSHWRRYIELGVGTYIGETITEVGIYSGSAYCTHAMLEDSDGNPITITKGEFDVVTIYATMYVTAGAIDSIVFGAGQIRWIPVAASNEFLRWLAGTAPTTYPGRTWTAGEGKDFGRAIEGVLGTRLAGAWVGNSGAKTISLPTTRFGTTDSNGRIRSLQLGDSSLTYRGSIHAIFPITGVWTTRAIVGEVVGTGDGVTTGFDLDWDDAIPASLTVYVDGVPTAVTFTPERSQIGIARYANLSAGGVGREVAAAPDGSYIISGEDSGSYDGWLTWNSIDDGYYQKMWNQYSRNSSNVRKTYRLSLHSSENWIIAAGMSSGYPLLIRVFPFDKTTGTIGASTASASLVKQYGTTVSMPFHPVAVDRFVTEYDNSTSARAWNLNTTTGALTAATTPPSGVTKLFDLAWSPCGAYLAYAYSGSPYFKVHPYDHALDSYGSATTPASAPPGGCYGVAFSPDNKAIVVLSNTSPFVVAYEFDSVAGTIGAQYAQPDELPAAGSTSNMHVTFSPDGTMVIVGTSIYTIDTVAGTWGHKLEGTCASRSKWINNSWIVGPGWAMREIVKTSKYNIEFAVAPAIGTAITADYSVNHIPKDVDHVFDINCEFIFA